MCVSADTYTLAIDEQTYLKKAGYLENTSRGVWALTDKARQEPAIDSREIVNFVRALDRKPEQTGATTSTPELSSDDSPEEAMLWREKLHHVLIEEMSPDAFSCLLVTLTEFRVRNSTEWICDNKTTRFSSNTIHSRCFLDSPLSVSV